MLSPASSPNFSPDAGPLSAGYRDRVAGALLGGFIAKELFGVQTLDTFFNPSTWVTAIVDAVVQFLLFGAVRGRRRTGSGRGRGRRWRRA